MPHGLDPPLEGCQCPARRLPDILLGRVPNEVTRHVWGVEMNLFVSAKRSWSGSGRPQGSFALAKDRATHGRVEQGVKAPVTAAIYIRPPGNMSEAPRFWGALGDRCRWAVLLTGVLAALSTGCGEGGDAATSIDPNAHAAATDSRSFIASLSAKSVASEATAGDFQVPESTRFIGNPGPVNPEFVPVDMAADGFGNVYVLDLLHEVVRKYGQSGELIETFDVGASQGIENTRTFTVDPLGYIYVADTSTSGTSTNMGNAKIVKFSPTGQKLDAWAYPGRGLGNNGTTLVAAGKFLDEVGIFDLSGQYFGSVGGPGIMHDPDDAAITKNGTIYTTHTYRKVLVYGSDGVLVRTYEKKNGFAFSWPASLALDSSENLFVSDRHIARIVKISPQGMWLGSVGSEGHGPGRFIQPHGIAVDSYDNVWVANYHGHNIQKFDNSLNHLLTIEGDDTALGEFSVTHGMGVDSAGDVYVADMWSNRVSKFDNRGNFVTAWGKRGEGEGAVFNFPRFITVDRDDNVYVASDGDIRKFDKHGNYIKRWGAHIVNSTTCGFTRCARGIAFDQAGNIYVTKIQEHHVMRIDEATGAVTSIGSAGNGPGQFRRPWGLAISGDRMLVADQKNHRVQVLTLDGSFLFQFGSKGSGDGQFLLPTALALDAAGRIYVGDSGNGRIQVFDNTGKFLGKWGTAGTGSGQFTEIHGMAVDARGSVFVSDWKNSTVQKFGAKRMIAPPAESDGKPAITWGVDSGAYLWSEGAEPGWRLRVSARAGQRVMVQLVADGELSNLALVGLQGSAVVQHPYGFSLDVTAQDSELGIDFMLPAGKQRIAVSVFIDGEYNPGMLRIGQHRATVHPSGWIFPVNKAPLLPAYDRGSDVGTFLGFNEGGKLELAFSAADLALRQDVHLLTSRPLTDVEGLSMETSDALTTSANSVSVISRTLRGYDGILVSVPNDSHIYFGFTVNNLLQPQSLNGNVNPNTFGLGLPSAAMILRN